MKAHRITCWMAVGMLVIMQAVSTNGEEVAFRPGVGLGILTCPGLKSYVGKLQSGDDGASAWMGFNVSGKIRVNDSWSLVAVMDGYFNGNGDPNFNGRTSKNTMFVPAACARYSFGEGSAFYVQAGPNFVVANGGGSDAEFKGGGIGGAASVGYLFRFGLELDLGYSYCPVEATGSVYHSSTYHGYRAPGSYENETTTENFGGVLFRVGYRF